MTGTANCCFSHTKPSLSEHTNTTASFKILVFEYSASEHDRKTGTLYVYILSLRKSLCVEYAS